MHKDLNIALEEQDILKAQVSEYANQVARVEDLLAQKVNICQLLSGFDSPCEKHKGSLSSL